VVVSEKRDRPNDWWFCGESWVDSKYRFLSYKRWYWTDVFVEYIGFMYNSGGGFYTLCPEHTDPYTSELSWPFFMPDSLLCETWKEVP